MQIINAAPKLDEDTVTEVQNPAANFGKYHEEFGFQPTDVSDLPPEVPTIMVNGTLIEEKWILTEVQHHPAETKRAAMVKAAESLIIGELLVQEAKRLNVIDKDVDRFSAAEAAGLTLLIEQEVPVPAATDEEKQRFYQANLNSFATSPMLEIRHILLPAAPDDIAERQLIKEQAELLIAQIQHQPADFVELVAQYSKCPSKQQGGNLGQISKGQTVAEFEQHIFKAQVGLISYPIETRYGFHVVLVERKVDGKQLPFDMVEDKVVEYLSEKVKRKATAHYIQTLIEQSEITGFNFDIETGLMQ